MFGLPLDRGDQCEGRRSRSTPSAATTSVTSGSPLVRVPVLSMTTTSMRAAASRAMAFLNRTPRWAPSPVPTMIAVGVARPRASGQVMTTTVIANSMRLARPADRPAATPAKVSRAADQGDEHQPERGPVGEPLAGGLGVLGLLDELDDLGERGVGADLGGPDPQGAVAVDGGADDLVAGLLVDREALAGHHRLVDLALALLDDAVDGDLGARADQQQVADGDLGGRDLDRLAVADDQRHGRGEVQQAADGVVGAATGAHLEPVAEEHERGQHGGGLVEDLAAAGEGDDRPSTASRRRRRPRPAPSCPGCGRAGRGRRRRRRSSTSRRSPAGSAAATRRRRAARTGRRRRSRGRRGRWGTRAGSGSRRSPRPGTGCACRRPWPAIDMPAWPPWPITSCGTAPPPRQEQRARHGRRGFGGRLRVMMVRVGWWRLGVHGGRVVLAVAVQRSGSISGSQMWLGTDCPAQCIPQSSTQRRRSAREVWGRVVDHRGGLGDGIGLDPLHPRTAPEHGLDHRLLRSPKHRSRRPGWRCCALVVAITTLLLSRNGAAAASWQPR